MKMKVELYQSIFFFYQNWIGWMSVITSKRCYVTFCYCKGGTSWMRNKDWSTLHIGKSWKLGVVLLKSNYHIAPLPQIRRKTRYLVLKMPAK